MLICRALQVNKPAFIGTLRVGKSCLQGGTTCRFDPLVSVLTPRVRSRQRLDEREEALNVPGPLKARRVGRVRRRRGFAPFRAYKCFARA